MIFAPFQGDQAIEHILYVGSDPLLRMQRAGQLHLTFQLTSGMDRSQIEPLLQAIQWQAFRGGDWVPLASPTFALGDESTVFTLTFPAFEGADVLALSGPGLDVPRSSRWIRGRLRQPITQLPVAEHLWLDSVSPQITRQLDSQEDTRIAPDYVHVNTAAVDFSKGFLPLGENPQVGDTISIASAEVLEKVEPSLPPEERGRVELAFDVDGGDATLQWEYIGAEPGQPGKWMPLQEGVGVLDETHAFRQDGKISLAPAPPPVPVRIPRPGGQVFDTVFLFRVSITEGTYRKMPGLRTFPLLLRVPGTPVRLVPPVIAFTSDSPLDVVDPRGSSVDLSGLAPVDLRTPFYPFGVNPSLGNTFYFGLPLEGPSAPGGTEPTVLLLPQTARLVWEFFGQNGWKRLGESSTGEATRPPTDYEFVDATQAFTRSGSVSFRRPADLAPGEVNGQTGYWLRARLVSGLYGRPLEFMPVDPAEPSKGFKLRPGTGALNAPVVSAIRLGYEARHPAPLVVTYNRFRIQDETATNQTTGAAYRPFEPVDDVEPTFYLAFDQQLPNDAVSLYFVVPARQFVEKLT